MPRWRSGEDLSANRCLLSQVRAPRRLLVAGGHRVSIIRSDDRINRRNRHPAQWARVNLGRSGPCLVGHEWLILPRLLPPATMTLRRHQGQVRQFPCGGHGIALHSQAGSFEPYQREDLRWKGREDEAAKLLLGQNRFAVSSNRGLASIPASSAPASALDFYSNWTGRADG